MFCRNSNSAPCNRIGARFQVDVDHAARRPAILRVVAVGQNAHLADRLHRRPDHERSLVDEVDHVDVVVDTVQQEVVLAGGTHAVGGKAAVLRVARARFRNQDAGRKPRQIAKHPLAAHGQLAHLSRVQIGALRGVLGLQQWRVRRDFDGLTDIADRQR